jgi:hypothetical protein
MSQIIFRVRTINFCGISLFKVQDEQLPTHLFSLHF